MLEIRNKNLSIILMGIIMLATIWLLGKPSVAEAKGDRIEVYVDQQPVTFTVQPLMRNGTTLVQLRPLFESLGIEITWDAKTETVSGKKESKTFALKLNSHTALIDGKSVALTTSGTTVNGHTLVPLRFVGEATGAVVGWNSDQQLISIYSEAYIEQSGLTKAAAQDEVNKGMLTRGQGAPRNFYAHWEMDVGGLRGCPNLCWDYYYFVNDSQVATALPDGGIDALDCNRDACLSYEIKGNTMTLNNGKSYSYKVISDKELEIDGDKYTKYSPVSGLKLQGKYESFSYTSSTLGSGLASSLTYTFNKDGTFVDSSFTGFTSDGSDSGDKSGVSTSVGSESNSSGNYTITEYTLLLKYKDGTTKKLFFFLPEQPSVNMLRIGGRDFLLKDEKGSTLKPQEQQPYSDLLTTRNIAEKEVLFTFEPKRSDQVSNIKITLEGYQWAKLKIDSAHSDSFKGFGDQEIVALTAKYRIQNASPETIRLSDLSLMLALPQSSATVKATQALAPKTREELESGESIETMGVLLVPADHFDKNKDFELRFGPLLDAEGKDVFQADRITFNIWKNL
ncbi:copper amine oxidase N-terminal domain-containing protein [Paenibacillus terrigena]|uniref:copper amine oxidase N-terminal domain-containing protein n=1 Tax=Paenibacillus terrigena TaxID=369333 RepID=UPI0028D23B18|nr:copper amine oxidase N-terminal domain-containing protein [Paenibacillus terrigena]